MSKGESTIFKIEGLTLATSVLTKKKECMDYYDLGNHG